MSGGGGGSGQDADINLAPIIDCFTVLIAFMLVSASFLSIGILDAGIAAVSSTPSTEKPPAITIEVLLRQGGAIDLKVGGKESRKISIGAAQAGAIDFERLGKELQPFKTKYADVQGATLSADAAVEYKDIILAMESTRKIFPAVALGGF